MTRKEREQLADKLKAAIAKSGMTIYKLSQASGVHRSQITRFMSGERDLGLAMAEKLCAVLGLELTFAGQVKPEPKKRKRKGQAVKGRKLTLEEQLREQSAAAEEQLRASVITEEQLRAMAADNAAMLAELERDETERKKAFTPTTQSKKRKRK